MKYASGQELRGSHEESTRHDGCQCCVRRMVVVCIRAGSGRRERGAMMVRELYSGKELRRVMNGTFWRELSHVAGQWWEILKLEINMSFGRRLVLASC